MTLYITIAKTRLKKTIAKFQVSTLLHRVNLRQLRRRTRFHTVMSVNCTDKSARHARAHAALWPGRDYA